MAVIREDAYGPYIKSDGSIARPVPTDDVSGYIAMNIVSETQYDVGQKVKSKHYAFSTLHQVGDEVWCGHGCYYDYTGGEKNSTDCWMPAK